MICRYCQSLMLKTYSADNGKLYEFNSCPLCYWQSQRGITTLFKEFISPSKQATKKNEKRVKANVRSIHNNTKRNKKTHKCR